MAGARFCARCGFPVGGADAGSDPLASLDENLAGALAYATPVPALAFLLIEPYRRNPFVRFHSYQCLLLTLAAMLLAAVSSVLAVFHFLEALLSSVLQLGLLAAWAFAAYKAWQGEKLRLPVVGDIAARHSRV